MPKFLLSIISVIAWFFCVNIALGNFFQTGLDAYNAGDYESALVDFERAAQNENPDAQHYLGYMHYNGLGTSQSWSLAAKWFLRAAKQGDKRAQYNLGVMYYRGKGVNQSYQEAVKWYESAAKQGDKSAQYNLGFMYYRGWGVYQNHQESVKWYRRAAEQGDKRAQYNLGLMYMLGQGVSKNLPLAHMWLEISARFGHGLAYETKEKIATFLSPAQKEKAEQLLKNCIEKKYQNCR